MPDRRIERTEIVEDRQSPVVGERKAVSYSAVDQAVYLIFGLIELLLFIRFVFRATGANPAAGIVRFVYSLTEVLMAPFRFIFPASQAGGSVVEWSVLVAMFFYALFAWIIMRLIRMIYTADRA